MNNFKQIEQLVEELIEKIKAQEAFANDKDLMDCIETIEGLFGLKGFGIVKALNASLKELRNKLQRNWKGKFASQKSLTELLNLVKHLDYLYYSYYLDYLENKFKKVNSPHNKNTDKISKVGSDPCLNIFTAISSLNDENNENNDNIIKKLETELEKYLGFEEKKPDLIKENSKKNGFNYKNTDEFEKINECGECLKELLNSKIDKNSGKKKLLEFYETTENFFATFEQDQNGPIKSGFYGLIVLLNSLDADSDIKDKELYGKFYNIDLNALSAIDVEEKNRVLEFFSLVYLNFFGDFLKNSVEVMSNYKAFENIPPIELLNEFYGRTGEFFDKNGKINENAFNYLKNMTENPFLYNSELNVELAFLFKHYIIVDHEKDYENINEDAERLLKENQQKRMVVDRMAKLIFSDSCLQQIFEQIIGNISKRLKIDEGLAAMSLLLTLSDTLHIMIKTNKFWKLFSSSLEQLAPGLGQSLKETRELNLLQNKSVNLSKKGTKAIKELWKQNCDDMFKNFVVILVEKNLIKNVDFIEFIDNNIK